MSGESHTLQSGGLTLSEGFIELLPKIGAKLSRLVGHDLTLRDVACGRHGCILYTTDGLHVVKITGDPSEALGWLYVQERQQQGHEAFLAGAVFIEGIWRVEVGFPGMFGTTHPQTFGVALLERVIPGHRKHHKGADRAHLSRTIPALITRRVCEPIPRIDKMLTKTYKALQANDNRVVQRLPRNAHSALSGLLRMVANAAKDAVWFEDVELHNVGWRLDTKPPTLVLFDLGRVKVKKALRARLRRRYNNIPIHDLNRPRGRWR